MNRAQVCGTAGAAAALALAPFYLSPYELSLVGRFLALAVLALGIVLLWGHAGVLSLGQGVFFGLGGYALAMHLKLAALSDALPDFMVWNGVQRLPWWWTPFYHSGAALGAAVLVPAVAAGTVAWLVFRRRITGVYVSLITQALTLAFATLLVSQQGVTGGFNGLTDFRTLLGYSLRDPAVQVGLYWVTLGVVASAYLLGRWLTDTHLGKLLVAIRDGENRVRFLGYDPAPYKVFAFTLAGALAGTAGALYTLHVGVISPAMVGVVPSIEMVVWVAVGGRDSLAGAVLATLGVNLAKDRISSAVPDLWLYLMGLLFILVVTVMPGGLAGWTRRLARPEALRWRGQATQGVAAAPAVKPEEA